MTARWAQAKADGRSRPAAGVTGAVVMAALLVSGCVTTCPACPKANCPADTPAIVPETGVPMIYTDPANHDFTQNPELLASLRADAFQYFRFVNVPFAQSVCARFEGDLRRMPVVNLHGDAHVEQYAVTSTARGVHDFDASTTGPAVIDLVRFGVSLALANDKRGWSARDADTLDAFIRGYRNALRDPDVARPTPSWVLRVRGAFNDDRTPFLTWAESLMDPGTNVSAFEKGYDGYVALMKEEYPDLPATFFHVKKTGRVRVGVGSALDIKLLARIEGPSAAPEDDVILEAKEVRDLRQIPCVNAMVGDAFRIMIAQARMADMPPRFMAQVPRVSDAPDDAPPFWVHEWSHDYQEVELANAPASADELIEIAYDVGAQLGRGHASHVSSPLDRQIRRAQLADLDQNEARIREAITDLTAMTLSGWERFRAESMSR